MTQEQNSPQKNSAEENAAPGTFCWAELGTSDTSAAREFYTKIFNWNFVSGSEDQSYLRAAILEAKVEKGVAGVYSLSQQQRSLGIPPHWLAYVRVSNVDESVETAERLGGSPLMKPFDVEGNGRMAVLRDPTGGVLAIWEASEDGHSPILSLSHGARAWFELATRDIKGSATFYQELFEWDARPTQRGKRPYFEFYSDHEPVGGMYEIPAEAEKMPPHWLIYFATQNCEETCRSIEAANGRIVVPPYSVPGVGRMAVVTDPQFGAFALLEARVH